jgi:hypothetical protein
LGESGLLGDNTCLGEIVSAACNPIGIIKKILINFAFFPKNPQSMGIYYKKTENPVNSIVGLRRRISGGQ